MSQTASGCSWPLRAASVCSLLLLAHRCSCLLLPAPRCFLIVCLYLLPATPGCSWSFPGCSWLLAAPGCPKLILAALSLLPGCSWLLLAVSLASSNVVGDSRDFLMTRCSCLRCVCLFFTTHPKLRFCPGSAWFSLDLRGTCLTHLGDIRLDKGYMGGWGTIKFCV